MMVKEKVFWKTSYLRKQADIKRVSQEKNKYL